MSPFEGKPHSIYVPAGSHWRVEAATDLTLAVCTAPGGAGTLPPRLIGPDDGPLETRGRGTNHRYVTHVLPRKEPAESLRVAAVIPPGAHTTGSPTPNHH